MIYCLEENGRYLAHSWLYLSHQLSFIFCVKNTGTWKAEMRSHTDMNLLVLAKLIEKSTNMLPVEVFYHGNNICQSFHCSDNTGAESFFTQNGHVLLWAKIAVMFRKEGDWYKAVIKGYFLSFLKCTLFEKQILYLLLIGYILF